MAQMTPDEITAKVKAATDADTVLWNELKAKIGEHPAAVISECANLVGMVRQVPALMATVDNLIEHAIDGFGLDREYVKAYIVKALQIRTVRISGGREH